MTHEEIIRRLQSHSVKFTVHEHVPAVTVQDALEKLPFPLEQFLKTVVFQLKSGGWVLVALRGQDAADYRKLATALNVKRDMLQRPTAEQIERELGFQVGGICPLPTNGNIQVVFDTVAMGLGTVYCGAGRNDRTIEIAVTDLAKVAGAKIEPVAQEPKN